MKSGIYIITNTRNNRVYVGSSANTHKRLIQHKGDLNRGDHCNPHLQSAWKKYGSNAFQFSILEKVEIDSLVPREQYWIDFFRSAQPKYGYNMAPVAGSVIGVKRSDGFKQGVSEFHKGKKLTEEHKRKIAEANRGRKHTEETKKKVSEHSAMKGIASEKHPMYGKKHTPEALKKISEKSKGHAPNSGSFKKGEEPWNKGMEGFLAGEKHYRYGKEVAPEVKAKISETLKGNIPWNKGLKATAPGKIRKDMAA